eukprot:gene24936-31334_t
MNASGIGSFMLAPIINHSCAPNAIQTFDDQGVITIRATRVIEKDEEVSISYTDTGHPTWWRREELLKAYHFHCECERCVATGSELEGFKCKHCPGICTQSDQINQRNVYTQWLNGTPFADGDFDQGQDFLVWPVLQHLRGLLGETSVTGLLGSGQSGGTLAAGGVALTLTVGQLIISQIFVEEFATQFMSFCFCEVVICLNPPHPAYHIEANRGPDFDTGITNEELTLLDYFFEYTWPQPISIQACILPTPPVGAFLIAICMLTVLFFLEGLMIAIVGTQYWDPETFREVHVLMSQPENVKRFIIGRQFFAGLLAQTCTMTNFPSEGYNWILLPTCVQLGLVGLGPSCFPLRFMNMRDSMSVSRINMFFDAIGVRHCAWDVYYVTHPL